MWEWIDHCLPKKTNDGREYFAYGGDFGEEVHDRNFVCDGLLFPNRDPSPGLIEYKKVIAPLDITLSDEGIVVKNKLDFGDTAHLAFAYRLETAGKTVAEGSLDVPIIAAGEASTVPLPAFDDIEEDSYLLVTASLGADEMWAPKGHEVAWGQFPISSQRRASAHASARPVEENECITLGPAVFDAHTGALVSLKSAPITSRLDVWRAPTDNDRGRDLSGTLVEAVDVLHAPTDNIRGRDISDMIAEAVGYVDLWQAARLDKMHERVDSVSVNDDALVVRTRSAAANTVRALRVTYTWTSDGDGLSVRVHVVPEGEWRIDGQDIPLPRLGLRLGLPSTVEDVEWFGLGPGESYPDSQTAVRMGSWKASIDELQTPYVFPQENGLRQGVRRAQLTGPKGGLAVEALAGDEIDGVPVLGLTARRWTSEQLDVAAHTTDLAPSDNVWVNLDYRHGGLGTGSCGPGVLPQYVVKVEEAKFGFNLRPL